MPVRQLARWTLPTLALACSPSNTLMGSMTDLTSLAFTQVQLHQQGSKVTLEYLDLFDGGDNVPFQLTVDAEATPLDAGHVFQLDGGTDAGAPVAIASRSVARDTRTFSNISFGQITFDGPVLVGDQGSGNFFVVFDYQHDGSLGAGRTVYGNFSAKVAP